MNDDDLRRAYAAFRSATPRSEAELPTRLSLEELQGLLDSDLSAERREELLDRVLADPENTRELALLHVVASASRERTQNRPVRPWMMAAAAILVVVSTPILWSMRDRNDAEVRSAPADAIPAVRLVAADNSTIQQVQVHCGSVTLVK